VLGVGTHSASMASYGLWGWARAMGTRRLYPTDISDEEWAFVAPLVILSDSDAPTHLHVTGRVPCDPLHRAVGRSLALPIQRFPALRGGVLTDLGWLTDGSFEMFVHVLR
jgi:hypothetical protein